MYRQLVKPLLGAFYFEQAFNIVILMLRLLDRIPGVGWLQRKCCAVEDAALEREVFGIHFRNPIGLAAGFDHSAECTKAFSNLGFGFVEVGTLTPKPQQGNPRPRIFRLLRDNAIIHRTGFPNKGLEAAIRHLRHKRHGVVGCNIGRNTSTQVDESPRDYLKLFRNLYQYADYFTVNLSGEPLSYDDLPRLREHLLAILEPLFDFRRGQNQYCPILVKVVADMPDEVIDLITDILIDTPLDGLIACDGSFARKNLQTSHRTLNQIGRGQLCGAPLLERTVEVVRRINARTRGTYPIIAVGGVMKEQDVLRLLDAGAALVQIYTGYLINGPMFVKRICRALIADAERRREEALALAECGLDTPDAKD